MNRAEARPLRFDRTSPRLKARIAGFLYLLIFLVAPDGAATATVANLSITLVCDVGVAAILYQLLRPVSRQLSRVAATCRLIFVAVMAVNALNYLGPLHLGRDSHSPASFNWGYGIALVPFGLHCLLLGYLIVKSTFLPRILGVLLMVAGLGYLTFVSPTLGDKLFFPYIVIPAVVGEGSLTLWLLVMGVNSEKWNSQAGQGTRAATGVVTSR